MQSLELLLQCVAHDYALHELRHASILVRRIARDADVQKEMQMLQLAIMEEVASRKQADVP